MSEAVIFVFDIGKSYNKVSVVNLSNGQIIDSNRCLSTSYQSDSYLALDIDTIWQRLLNQLKHLNKQYNIVQITITTHGAAAALIDDKDLVFPVMDYEFDDFNEINPLYNKVRPPFSETGSENLSMGLNLGRQLFWLQTQFPEKWKTVKNILMLPQFFGWKLTGRCVSELTSLGCHTDLWDYKNHCFSSLISQCNWGHLFPNMTACGEQVGPITDLVSELTGLKPSTLVLNGIHDSNATLVPYLKSKEQPLNIISSGTWTVINSIIQNKSSIPLIDGMMISMSYQGNPIPSIRFMGGREWQLLQPEQMTVYDINDIKDLIQLPCYPLASFTKSGPFSRNKGTIIGEASLSATQRAAVATLYVALLTRYCLDLLNNPGDIIVEGSFISNTEYLQILQCLSPQQKLFISDDVSGTTAGAVRLSPNSEHWPDLKFNSVDKIQIPNLASYYQQWLHANKRHQAGQC